jgi:2-keto-3-deoxy-L-rhamnonate aldolase RhmA
MKANDTKRALKAGKTVFGTMIAEVRTPMIANVLAEVGFDYMFIDTEHGPYNLAEVHDIVRVARLAGITPLVRVPDPEYFLISRPLDLGAQGIMVPRVETREQVELIVQSAKFPPVGKRGCSQMKGHSDYHKEPLNDFVRQSNEENMVILQIERERAINNIDDLLSVSGVDVALIGPNDLSISLGIPGEMDHPLLRDSIQKVVDSCERHGLVSGIHISSLDALQYWMRQGMRMITWNSPLGMIMSSAQDALRTLKA